MNDILKINPDTLPKALLFDLDGTLVDSVPDIATSTNLLLVENNHAPLEVDEVRLMIGNGIKKLVERAFSARNIHLNDDELEEHNNRMMAIYSNHLTDETTFMPGAKEVVTAYAEAGTKIAVVTNKPEAFSRTIITNMGFDSSIHCVVGGDTAATRKPEPEMLFHACKELGTSVDDTIMVGDSPADISAAINAKMKSIAVRGGYTNIPVEELGAGIVIDNLLSLPNAIEAVN